jgi:hypothetical protein
MNAPPIVGAGSREADLVLPPELAERGFVPAGRAPGLGSFLLRALGEEVLTGGSGTSLVVARPVATLGCPLVVDRLGRLARVEVPVLAPVAIVPGPGRAWVLRPWMIETAEDCSSDDRRESAAWLEREGADGLEALWASGLVHGALAPSNLGVAQTGQRCFLDGGLRWVGTGSRPRFGEERAALARLTALLRNEGKATEAPTARGSTSCRRADRPRRANGVVSSARRRPAAEKIVVATASLGVAVGLGAWWRSTSPSSAPRRRPVLAEGRKERSVSGATVASPPASTPPALAERRASGQRASVPECALVGVASPAGPCRLRVVGARRVVALARQRVVGEWVVGHAGDVVVLGHWWCGPVPDAGSYDPNTGVVSLFGGWPKASGGSLVAVAVRQTGVRHGLVTLETGGTGGRCERLVVRPGRQRH